MDFYKCEKCGKLFDEFEMNYRAAQVDKKCWCNTCRKDASSSMQRTCADSPTGEHYFQSGLTIFTKFCAYCGTRQEQRTDELSQPSPCFLTQRAADLAITCEKCGNLATYPVCECGNPIPRPPNR